MKVLVVAGARPNYVKAAPLLRALDAAARDDLSHCFVDVGQHYDDALAGSFFRTLDLPAADHSLAIGSGSHASQTALAMQRFETVLAKERPDVVVVLGDVNATLACALVAAKSGIRVAHVEAGLRSFDRSMPEEVNRVVVDALADDLFTTEESANVNLRREGVAEGNIHFVGNLMVDSLDWMMSRLAPQSPAAITGVALPAGSRFAIATLHRAANVDEPERLEEILGALATIATELPVLLPIHPRTRERLACVRTPHLVADSGPSPGRVTLLQPLTYSAFLSLLSAAHLVLTDSGGVQEEATCLSVPCVTLRDNTERPVTIAHGTNVLGGTRASTIVAAARERMSTAKGSGERPPLWDGRAAERIVARLAAARPR